MWQNYATCTKWENSSKMVTWWNTKFRVTPCESSKKTSKITSTKNIILNWGFKWGFNFRIHCSDSLFKFNIQIQHSNSAFSTLVFKMPVTSAWSHVRVTYLVCSIPVYERRPCETPIGITFSLMIASCTPKLHLAWNFFSFLYPFFLQGGDGGSRGEGRTVVNSCMRHM